MKNQAIMCLAAAGLLILPVRARTQTPAASLAKVGVINIQEAILSTSEGKKAMGDLQKKYAPRQQDIQRMQQEIQSISEQLQKQGPTLSDDEQRRLNRSLESKQTLLKRATEDAQADFAADRDEAVRRIGQKMVRLLQEYGQQNGYTLILDEAQIPVYFAAKDIELTEEMIKRYDAANPVEADAGASAPAARPAAGSPAKPGTTAKPGDKPKP